MLGLEADHYGDTVILASYLAPRSVSVQVDLFTKKTIWCMDRPVGLPESLEYRSEHIPFTCLLASLCCYTKE